MTVEQLGNVLHAQPFRPFTIHMGDDRSFLVRHQDFVSRSETGRTIIVHGTNESFSVLDLLLVTELDLRSLHERRTSTGKQVPKQPAVVEKDAPPKRPKLKNDPVYFAAARELRHRYLEQLNAGAIELRCAGKHKITCAITAKLTTPAAARLLPAA